MPRAEQLQRRRLEEEAEEEKVKEGEEEP